MGSTYQSKTETTRRVCQPNYIRSRSWRLLEFPQRKVFSKNSFYPSIANKLFWRPQHLHISGSASSTFFCMCLLSHAMLPLREMLSPLNNSQLQSGPMQIPVNFCSCNYCTYYPKQLSGSEHFQLKIPLFWESTKFSQPSP